MFVWGDQTKEERQCLEILWRERYKPISELKDAKSVGDLLWTHNIANQMAHNIGIMKELKQWSAKQLVESEESWSEYSAEDKFHMLMLKSGLLTACNDPGHRQHHSHVQPDQVQTSNGDQSQPSSDHRHHRPHDQSDPVAVVNSHPHVHREDYRHPSRGEPNQVQSSGQHHQHQPTPGLVTKPSHHNLVVGGSKHHWNGEPLIADGSLHPGMSQTYAPDGYGQYQPGHDLDGLMNGQNWSHTLQQGKMDTLALLPTQDHRQHHHHHQYQQQLDDLMNNSYDWSLDINDLPGLDSRGPSQSPTPSDHVRHHQSHEWPNHNFNFPVGAPTSSASKQCSVPTCLAKDSPHYYAVNRNKQAPWRCQRCYDKWTRTPEGRKEMTRCREKRREKKLAKSASRIRVS